MHVGESNLVEPQRLEAPAALFRGLADALQNALCVAAGLPRIASGEVTVHGLLLLEVCCLWRRLRNTWCWAWCKVSRDLIIMTSYKVSMVASKSSSIQSSSTFTFTVEDLSVKVWRLRRQAELVLG